MASLRETRAEVGGRLVLHCCVLAVGLAAMGSSDARPVAGEKDSGARIIAADAEPQNWLSTGRNYQETRYSPLEQIKTSNIANLKLAWFYDLDTHRGQEGTPLAVDGVVYTTSAWSKVQAIEGET